MLWELYLAQLMAKAREAELERQLELGRLLEEARRARARRPRRVSIPLASLRPRPSRA